MCIENSECLLYKNLERLVNNLYSKPFYNVFHYTDALSKILKSGHLKLKKHADLNLNNNEELKCGKSLIINEMKLSRSLLNLIELFDSYLENGITICTGSFCEKKKSNYASKKYGKSKIAFNPSFFLNAQKRAEMNNSACIYGKVIYSKKYQAKLIKKIFKCFDQYSHSCNNQYATLFLWLSIILPLLKPSSHSQDQEHRIICCEILDRNKELATEECFKEINFLMEDIKYLSHKNLLKLYLH